MNIASKLAELVGEGLHVAMNEMQKHGGGTMDYINICATSAMCALQTVAPLVAKRPPVTNAEQVAKLINRDTMLFGALIVANMHEDLKVLEQDDKQGVFESQSSFNFAVLAKALADWEKLTGKNPEDIFEPFMLQAIKERAAEDAIEPTDPFAKFLKERNVKAPSTRTIN